MNSIIAKPYSKLKWTPEVHKDLIPGIIISSNHQIIEAHWQLENDCSRNEPSFRLEK